MAEATKAKKKTASKSRSNPAAGKNLVIVESPSKAKTIGKYLGTKYRVIATVGHVRDLPKSKMGVDIDNNFVPHYINVIGKADVINGIKKEAKAAAKVFIATDPDREGEAIAWHVCNILGIDPKDANRIEFNEITKQAIQEAVKNPRPIDMQLVDAQQGRRVIDRVVGYGISPLLSEKVNIWGLSAGRVQSAALKIIVDREREIAAFVPQEYWVISAEFAKEGAKTKFPAKLEQYKGKKFTIPDKKAADDILASLKQGAYSVSSLKEKQDIRKPYAPYTTSTLMQDASSRIGFSPERTRATAQQLYEGIDMKGRGHVGLVTYIRTDSVRISDEADAACKAYIRENFSDEYLGNTTYANKSQNTQDAHEAIRPVDVNLEPESIKDLVTSDQYRLYKLIWGRFVASRMKNAVYDSVSADIANGDYTFKASGRRLVFDGFLKVYGDSSDSKDKMLPALTQGETLTASNIKGEQKFTEGPSRYTEASLIKELEDKGIGRPSTYASIVTTLEKPKKNAGGYIEKIKEKKGLRATDLGIRVTEIMENYFKEIVDSGFTAGMEEGLDTVAEGKAGWQKVVSDYYDSYVRNQLVKAGNELEKQEKTVQYTGENCPECGKPLVKKHGKYGEFVACSGYPDCKYIQKTPKQIIYVGVKCPSCGGELVEKRSRKGKIFYGCANYPKCNQAYWDLPVDKKCPDCGALLTKKGKNLVCSNRECGYKEADLRPEPLTEAAANAENKDN